MVKLKAALFDLGGTLMEGSTGESAESALARVAPRAIRLLPPEQAATVSAQALGTAVRRSYLDLEARACAGDRSPVPAERCVMEGMASLGVEVDTTMARAMLDALYISEPRSIRMLPGAEETLHTLAASGMRLGIISNRMHGGTRLLDDLDYFGISHLFNALVASCDAGQMKPHPALFHQALEDLGVQPGEAVMVGDDLCADIGGALEVGMRAIWMRRPSDRTDQPPTGVPAISRLDEIPGIIKSWER